MDMENLIANYKNNNGFHPTVCIELLNWCNLACKVCRSNSSSRMKDKIDYNILIDFLKDLRNNGKWRLSLTGGEPLYYSEIVNLLQFIYESDFQFSITTNGYNSIPIFDSIDRMVWQKGTLYISLDGTKDFTDNNRGKGVYDKVIKFIRHVRPVVNKMNISTAIYSDPTNWGKDLYDEICSLGVDNWTIISPINDGRFNLQYFTQETYDAWANELLDLKINNTSITYLNFAKSHAKKQDVAFIDPLGNIQLPGYHETLKDKPLSRKASIYDYGITDNIVDSFNNLFLSENYIF